MRRWLGLAVTVGLVLMMGNSSWGASSMVVKGVIGQWGELKAKMPASAYLQVVKLEDNMRGTTDQQGLPAFDSEFPKIKVRANGSFQVDLKGAPEGKYFIALQRAIPGDISGSSLASAIPVMITGKGEPVIIEVPGTFPLDVGRVDLAIRPEKAPSAGKKK